jgi:hypothetical protein
MRPSAGYMRNGTVTFSGGSRGIQCRRIRKKEMPKK